MELTSFSQAKDSLQNSSLTSIFVGVFLNDPLPQFTDFTGITEANIYARYGSTLKEALREFSTYSVLEQLYVIQSLKR